MINVYVSIGNSDDKLTQRQWCEFHRAVDGVLMKSGVKFHGKWTSAPVSQFQNACWCFEMADNSFVRDFIQRDLADAAYRFGQDAIAWAETPQTVFIGPVEKQ